MLTVKDFLSWQKANAAALRDREKAIRLEAEHTTVTFVVREMGKGLSLQDAGNKLVRSFKYVETTCTFRNAARDALKQMGWQPPPHRNNRDGGAEQ